MTRGALDRFGFAIGLSLLPILLGACGPGADNGFESRLQRLEARLTSVDQRLAALEIHFGLGSQNHGAFHERIDNVWWDGRYCQPVYRGLTEIRQKPVGPLPGSADGLAFAPDGRIVVSVGHGSHKDMRIFYWNPSGTFEPVVKLQHAPRTDRGDRPAREEEGVFGFFAGPVALDAGGTCYFSLGNVSPNGIYKVVSADPVRIEKLHDVDGTRSLQIPRFDPDHLYSTSWNGIFRLPLTPSAPGLTGNPWFRVSGNGIRMTSTLILSQTRVIARVVIQKSSDPKVNSSESRTLLFDKQGGEYWSLPFDDFGPMAISADGNRLIHFDQAAGMICEFEVTAVP